MNNWTRSLGNELFSNDHLSVNGFYHIAEIGWIDLQTTQNNTHY